jgi:DNA-binding transcriptional LysR family regulator
VVVGAPSYFRRFGTPEHPEDLLRHTCIRYRFASGRLYRWEFEKDGAALEVDAPGRLTLNDPLLCVRAAEDGLGLAIVFEDLAEAELADGRLVRTLEDWSPPFPGFMLYYPRQRRMSSALRAFIDLARTS